MVMLKATASIVHVVLNVVEIISSRTAPSHAKLLPLAHCAMSNIQQIIKAALFIKNSCNYIDIPRAPSMLVYSTHNSLSILQLTCPTTSHPIKQSLTPIINLVLDCTPM